MYIIVTVPTVYSKRTAKTYNTSVATPIKNRANVFRATSYSFEANAEFTFPPLMNNSKTTELYMTE